MGNNRDLRRILMGMLILILTAGTAAGADSWDAGRPEVTIVTNGWVEVRDILRNVAANTGLGLQMAPDVSGQVNVHLEGVPVAKALDALLTPADLGYEVVDNVLVVYKEGMVTRWITFDYPVTQRVGRGELEVSASSSSDNSSAGGGSGEQGSNKSHVTSTASMSIWPEVMESLKVMVFKNAQDLEEKSGGEESLAVSLSDDEGRTLVANPMASMVMVTAEWSRVHQVQQLLERLEESLQRQVAIEVRIMEVYLDAETNTGINWDILNLDSDISSVGLSTFDSGEHIGNEFFQFTLNSKHLTSVMEAISSSGDIRTVSTPKVTTLNNQKAVIRIVTENVFYQSTVEPAVVTDGVATEPIISYTPQTYPVGVVLDVTPQVGQDRLITLNVHPTISDIVGTAESPNEDTAPILSIRELDTVGKVRDGETLVIAGLMSERNKQTRVGLPFLKDLPVLGYFFGKTTDQKVNIELVMLLTPVIMEGKTADSLAKAELDKMNGKM